MDYKPLDEKHQPQPRLPEGYGVVCIDGKDYGGPTYTRWLPVRLLTVEKAKTYLLKFDDYFHNPYGGGPLAYRDRRRAIGFLWRWYRRYGEDGLHLAHNVAPCSAGVPGHLYQHEGASVANAAERLGLSTKDIHWIRKHADLKERLVSKKAGRNYFHNYYVISLAHLEAYLDTHGYKDSYVNMTELRRQRPSLPYVVWCI